MKQMTDQCPIQLLSTWVCRKTQERGKEVGDEGESGLATDEYDEEVEEGKESDTGVNNDKGVGPPFLTAWNPWFCPASLPR